MLMFLSQGLIISSQKFLIFQYVSNSMEVIIQLRSWLNGENNHNAPDIFCWSDDIKVINIICLLNWSQHGI